jgi:hypothetical protein
MEFQIYCPHCNKTIRASDFQSDQIGLSKLKDYFESHKNEFIKQLEKELELKNRDANKLIIESETNKLQNEINILKGNFELEKNNIRLQLQQIHLKEVSEISNQLLLIKKEKETSESLIRASMLNAFSEKELKMIEEINFLKKEINLINSNTKIDLQKSQFEAKAAITAKEIELINIHNKSIEEYKEKISKMELETAKGRNMAIGIKGSNLENEFESNMLQIYNDGNFEKTTKAINSRKPDFRLNVKNADETIGSILFEIKNTDKIDSEFEDKLSKEIIEWGANYGIIVWSNFKGSIKCSDKYPNIFTVNTDFPNITTLIGILKIVIAKEYVVTKSASKTEKDVIDFRSWINEKLSKTISKLLNEVDKIRSEVKRLNTISSSLIKIEEEMRETITNDIEDELKRRGYK